MPTLVVAHFAGTHWSDSHRSLPSEGTLDSSHFLPSTQLSPGSSSEERRSVNKDTAAPNTYVNVQMAPFLWNKSKVTQQLHALNMKDILDSSHLPSTQTSGTSSDVGKVGNENTGAPNTFVNVQLGLVVINEDDVSQEVDGMRGKHTSGSNNPLPSTRAFPGSSDGMRGVVEEGTFARNIIMDISSALSHGDETEAIQSFDHLKMNVGLKNLTTHSLGTLLHLLTKHSCSTPLVDDVFDAIEDKQVIDELPLKQEILTACDVRHLRIVRSLLPHLGIGQRIFVLQSSKCPMIRTYIRYSFDGSALARALVYTAKSARFIDFFGFLIVANGNQEVLEEALSMAKLERVHASYVEALEKAIEGIANKSK